MLDSLKANNTLGKDLKDRLIKELSNVENAMKDELGALEYKNPLTMEFSEKALVKYEKKLTNIWGGINKKTRSKAN